MEENKGSMQDRKEKMGNVALCEQETTINFTRDGNSVSIWTSDRTVMTKLDRLCVASPENYRCTDIGRDLVGFLISKTYCISDKKLLSFRSARQEREYTEEQLEEMRERLRIMREKQKAIKEARAADASGS